MNIAIVLGLVVIAFSVVVCWLVIDIVGIVGKQVEKEGDKYRLVIEGYRDIVEKLAGLGEKPDSRAEMVKVVASMMAGEKVEAVQPNWENELSDLYSDPGLQEVNSIEEELGG